MEIMYLKDFLSCSGDSESKKEGLATFDLKKTTMSFKETTEIGKYLEYRNSRGDDVDVCPLNQEIYQTLWGKTERSASALAFCKAEEIIKGETMNSVQTMLNQMFIMLADKYGLTLLKGRWKWSLNACLKLYEADAEKLERIVEEIDGTEDFLKVAYTIGNFIPWPANCNGPRGSGPVKDYWDLTLYCIKKWYDENEALLHENLPKLNNGALVDLFGSQMVNFSNWLAAFGSWDEFVRANYMQNFVHGTDDESDAPDDGPFGKPKELWNGHFSGNVLPEGERIEEFFKEATKCIEARSARMVKELRRRFPNQQSE